MIGQMMTILARTTNKSDIVRVDLHTPPDVSVLSRIPDFDYYLEQRCIAFHDKNGGLYNWTATAMWEVAAKRNAGSLAGTVFVIFGDDELIDALTMP